LGKDTLTEPTISVVVPVYGCVNCLEQLCKQLVRSLSTFTGQFEILLVDDRSPDDVSPENDGRLTLEYTDGFGGPPSKEWIDEAIEILGRADRLCHPPG
jgi:hypothetical protein